MIIIMTLRNVTVSVNRPNTDNDDNNNDVKAVISTQFHYNVGL